MSNNNSYINKVKFYIIGLIILIIIVGRFVTMGLNNNTYFTLSSAMAALKSIKYKIDFKNSPNKVSATSIKLNSMGVDYSQSIPVLVYHGIPYSDIPTEFSITIEKFKDQMFAIKKAGYTSITTEDLYAFLKGQKNLPEKSILITFDDGRSDSVDLADPVLKSLGFKATMFVIGRYTIEGERLKYYLSSNRLKTINNSGRWDIQAHSYDGHNSYFVAPEQQEGHFFSHKQWIDNEQRIETDEEFEQRIKTDMEKAKNGLSELIDKEIIGFGFPFGDFGQNNTNYQGAQDVTLKILEQYYKIGFYQISPTERYQNAYFLKEQADDETFMVRRITVDSNWTGSDLLEVLQKSVAKKLPYYDDFEIDRGWMTLWGKTDLGSRKLTLDTEPGETGGTILLDGTRLWKDYSVKATVESKAQSSVYIWARFKNDNNNVACNFGNGFIHIEQSINGNKNIIKGVIDDKFNLPQGEFTVEARVKGRNVACILNDTNIVETPFINPSLDSGGIGFKTWQKTPDMAGLTIKRLEVK